MLALCALTAGAPVTSLPGLTEPICWKHESGYLPVKNGAKQLFFWYHEATESPETKPWLLWLNGGPGCSSLGGMFTELGPFVVDASMNVTLNPWSWNKLANVIFVEQPAGVGFSFPNAPANDSITAEDTVEALVEARRRLARQRVERPVHRRQRGRGDVGGLRVELDLGDAPRQIIRPCVVAERLKMRPIRSESFFKLSWFRRFKGFRPRG